MHTSAVCACLTGCDEEWYGSYQLSLQLWVHIHQYCLQLFPVLSYAKCPRSYTQRVDAHAQLCITTRHTCQHNMCESQPWISAPGRFLRNLCIPQAMAVIDCIPMLSKFCMTLQFCWTLSSRPGSPSNYAHLGCSELASATSTATLARKSPCLANPCLSVQAFSHCAEWCCLDSLSGCFHWPGTVSPQSRLTDL